MARYGFWHGLRGSLAGIASGIFTGCLIRIIFTLWGGITGAAAAPDPASGAIHAYVQKGGGIVYLTGAQLMEANIIYWIIPLAFLGGLIAPRTNFRSVLMGARWDSPDPYHVQTITTIAFAVVTIVALYFYPAEIFGWLADLWFGLTAS